MCWPRFGRQGEFAHRIASGGDDRPPDTVEPPSGLVAVHVLDDPAHHVDTLVFIARQLADELTDSVERRRQGVHAAGHHRRDRSQRAQRTAVVSLDRACRRQRWSSGPDGSSMPGSTAPALTAGVTMLRLEPVEVRSDDGVQLGLWGGRTQADEWAARAVARLATLAGAEHVLVPAASGWPAARRCVRLGSGGHRRSCRARPAPDSSRRALAGQLAEPVAGDGACRTVGDRRARRRGSPGAGHRQGSGQRCPGNRATQHEHDQSRSSPGQARGRWRNVGGTPTRARRSARFQLLTESGSLLLVCLERQQWWLLGDYC